MESLPSFTKGKTFGEYKILSEIARGGMGIVYKAQHTKMHRIVALKVLLQSFQEEPKIIQRFFREAQVTAKLKHPNIVEVYHLGKEQGYPFFVMQYIEGETLADYLKKPEASLNDKLQIIEKVCDALETVHQEKILHRDIKPSNILIDQQGIPYITDFGIAHCAEGKSLTQTGALLGTAFYMSPERLRGHQRNFGPEIDVFSLGVILYEILTGNLPFQGKSLGALSREILEKNITFPASTPRDIQIICRQALAKKASNRYPQTKLLAQDLKAFRQGKKLIHAKSSFFSQLQKQVWISILAIITACLFFTVTYSKAQKTSPRQLLQTAQKHYQKKDYRNALVVVEKYLQEKPESSTGIALYQSILQDSKNWEKLRLLWLRLSQSQSYSITLLHRSASAAWDLGYIEEAKSLWQKTLQESPANAKQIQQYLAKVYFYQGNLSLARNLYSQNSSPDAQVYLTAIFYLQNEWEQAQNSLKNIQIASITHQRTLALNELVTGLLHWQKLSLHLGSWHWLFTHKKAKVCLEERDYIQKELQIVAQHLTKALEQVSSSSHFWDQRFQQQVNFYQQLLEIEKATSLSTTIAQVHQEAQNLIPTQRAFFYRVACRHYLRQQEWLKTVELGEIAKKDFPWESDYFQYLGIAYYRLNQRTESEQHIHLARELDPAETLVTENFLVLLSEGMGQEEFRLSSKLIWSNMQANDSHLMRLLFLPEVDKLRQEFSQQRPVIPPKPSHLAHLWKIYFQSKNVPPLVLEMLARSPEILNQPEHQKWSTKYPQKWKKLENYIKEFQLRNQRQTVRKTLFLYSNLLDNKYLISLYHLKNDGEKILCEIIRDKDEQPMMRFLAANALIRLGTRSAWQQLEKMSQEIYPVNLLATIGLLQHPTLQETILPQKIKQLLKESSQSKFYDRVIMLYAPTDRFKRYKKFLIQKPARVIALTMNFMRSNIKSKNLLYLRKQLDTIIRQPQYQNWHIAACDTLWRVAGKTYDLGHRRPELANKFWQQHKQTFLYLTEPNHPLRATFLGRMIRRHYIFRYVSRNDPIFQKFVANITQGTEDKNIEVKTKSLFAFGLLGEITKVWGFVQNKNLPYMQRLGVLFGLLLGDQTRVEDFLKKIMPRLLITRGKNLDINLRTQLPMAVACFVIERDPGKIRNNIYEKIIHQFSKVIKQSSDLETQRSQVGSLFWRGQKNDIDKLQRAFQSAQEPLTRKVVAIALFGNVVRYHPKKFSTMLEQLVGDNIDLRRSIAWGLHDLALVEIWPGRYEMLIRKEEQYQKYLQYLRQRANYRSLEMLENACQASPNSRYFYEAAVANFALQRPEKGRYYLQKTFQYLKKNNTNSIFFPWLQELAWKLEGENYLREENYTKALYSYQEALKINPFSKELQYQVGYLLQKKKQYTSALEHFWSAFYQGNDQALIPIARNYLLINEVEKAKKTIQRYSGKKFFREYFLYDPIFQKLPKSFWKSQPSHPAKKDWNLVRESTITNWYNLRPIFKPWEEIASLDKVRQHYQTDWKILSSAIYEPDYRMTLVNRRLARSNFLRLKIWSPRSQQVHVYCASEGKIRVFGNNKILLNQKQDTEFFFDRHKLSMQLVSGDNEIIAEVLNWQDKPSFQLRIVNPDNSLPNVRFSPPQPGFTLLGCPP